MKLLKNKIVALSLTAAMVFSVYSPNPLNTTAATGTVPTNLSFSVENDGSATIRWNSVSGATSYVIYEAKSRFANYEVVATVDGTSYTDDTYTDGYYKVAAVVNGSTKEKSEAISYEIQTFGTDTYIFEDTDTTSEIQNVIDTTYKLTGSGEGQFCSQRTAFMFKPSSKTYDVTADVGFYTQVSGLGISPDDVTVKQIQSKARWMVGKKYDGSVNYSALCNFWREVENMSTPANDTVWAVSQATSMRRMDLTGSSKKVNEYSYNANSKKWERSGSHVDPNNGILYLHDEGGYASGGFLADTKIATKVESGSQQQWLSRNIVSGAKAYSETDDNYSAAVWNNVLVGCKTSIKESNWPQGSSTVVDKTPVIAEKPFMIYNSDLNEYGIVVPKIKKDTQGVSWENMTEEDYTYISIKDCYVAKPTDSAAKINEGMGGKKALILTPGIYEVDQPIEVEQQDMVVLGLGLATIKPTKGNQCIKVGNSEGVRIAGVLFDAGRVQSDVLLTVGVKGMDADHSANPVVLSDCFFRVGGADNANCRTKTCVIINTNDVICDNFWVWRADHGAGVGWDKNTCDNGVIFNGRNITAYGLMVEHFQKVQTQWNADGGRCFMYQSELPYDIKSQSVWNEPGSYGYTDYKVANNVKTHEGVGIGVYSCYQKAQCFLKSAVTCPNTPGVKFTNVCTYSLVGNGGIDYVINNAGYSVLKSSEMSKVMSYCNGVAKADREGSKAKKHLFSSNISITGKSRYESTFKKSYTGKNICPTVTVSYSGITLRPGVDYTVSYANNKNIGTGKITIKGAGQFEFLSGAEVYKFKIVPAKVVIAKKKSKVTKKAIKLSWGKVKGAKKYEVKYSTKKSFPKKKTITKIVKKNKVTIKRKEKGKYFVKVRAFKKVGKKNFYGSFSKKFIAK
ncbi:MAG: hypothetical protein K6G64_05230 [Eubacterium sp.]|nr:hypothetical protein [Eubacterium sp.]